MKRSIKTVSGFSIETRDKTKGKIKDLLFDEIQWIVRYIEADFGTFFRNKRVLIPKAFFELPDRKGTHLPIALRDGEISKCPDIDHHLPVSRQYEKALYKHYGTNPYWPTANMGLSGGFYPPRPIIPRGNSAEEKIDSVLRSFKEVEGYQIHATDGRLGHLEDLVVDEKDWQIAYGVVDTSNWMPWSKKVMVPLVAMEGINYMSREVNLRMDIESIRNAPEYNPSEPINPEYEEGIRDFFSSSLVK